MATILEGSVRRSATQMRITAQLMRGDQSPPWSQTFDRRFDEDVFAVQDGIARVIVAALRIELGGGDAPSIAAQRGTQTLEAYNAYLFGRFQWNRRTRDGVLGSIESFTEAIRADPNYARQHGDCGRVLRCGQLQLDGATRRVSTGSRVCEQGIDLESSARG